MSAARSNPSLAEMRNGVLVTAGQVQFVLAGKSLWQRLDPLRGGPTTRSGMVPVRPELAAEVCYLGHYHTGWLRDGVLLSVG